MPHSREKHTIATGGARRKNCEHQVKRLRALRGVHCGLGFRRLCERRPFEGWARMSADTACTALCLEQRACVSSPASDTNDSELDRQFKSSRHFRPVVRPGEPNEACPHHRGLCAFDASDPERCPWCHSLWSVIRVSGWHSCERAAMWRPGARARVGEAASMRQSAAEAAQGLNQGATRPPEGDCLADGQEAAGSSPDASVAGVG